MKAYLRAIPKPRLIAFIAWSLGVAILAFTLGSLSTPRPSSQRTLSNEDVWELPEPGEDYLVDESEKVDPPDSNSDERAAPEATESELIVVHITGAVVAPGVYRLPPTARVADLVWLAGGLTPDADQDRINLAGYLKDAEQIKVWRQGENDTAINSPSQSASQAADGLININTASAAELESLPKIGPALAQAIIKYRTENGPFTSVDDLEQISGISSTIINGFRDRITVQ
jgi:competence protein ComEA helix-hairpin-helix repeat region